MLFKKYRNEKYTVAFIAIDSKCGLPVQATATAHKKGKTMIIGPAWASIKTQNGIALNGVYNIISEAVNGKYTIINAEKKEA